MTDDGFMLIPKAADKMFEGLNDITTSLEYKEEDKLLAFLKAFVAKGEFNQDIADLWFAYLQALELRSVHLHGLNRLTKRLNESIAEPPELTDKDVRELT